MASTPLEALTALAEALGADASREELERAMPIVTRALKNAVGRDPLPDLGETEPAFGLQFRATSRATRQEDPDAA